MNAESLRNEYNTHYRQGPDHWSCHDSAAADALVARLLRRLEKLGLSSAVKKGAALDVGCAKGHIAAAFQRAGFTTHGLDYSDVAIDLARKNFPVVTFHHMDGFNPVFDRKFSLILIRAFSGCNTLDMRSVAALASKYVALLEQDGVIIVGYTTDYSGKHRPGDTVCWSKKHIAQLKTLLPALYKGKMEIPAPFPLGWMKVTLGRLLGRRSKFFLYLVFTRSPV